MSARSLAARLALTLIVASIVSTATACGRQRVTAGPPAGQDLVVLLPDLDNRQVGAALVSNPLGMVSLTGAFAASETRGGAAPAAPTILTEARVTDIFGAALDALPLAPLQFTLGFKFDSDELTDDARAMLPMILRAVRDRPVPELSVVGHTDTTGDKGANIALGLRRANTVRAVLLQSGFDASYIEVSSHGESDLLVSTGDDTSEPLNRRVEITVR